MNLVVDIGNNYFKLGVFENSEFLPITTMEWCKALQAGVAQVIRPKLVSMIRILM